jgi:sugar transferase (PEP-CTERM system associated)
MVRPFWRESLSMRIGGQKVPVHTMMMVVFEAILIVIGLLVSTALRFHSLQAIQYYVTEPYAKLRFLFVVLVCQISFYYYDLYDFGAVRRRTVLVVRTLQALGLACVVLGAAYYVRPELSLGRGIAVLAAPSIAGLVLAWRLIVTAALPFVRQTERVLVLGTGEAGISVVREMVYHPELHYKVLGFLDERGENIGKSLVNPGIIGAAADVVNIVRQQSADRVVISLAERRGTMPVQQLLELKFSGVKVEDAHTMFERMHGRILLEHLSPSTLILSDGFKKSKLTLMLKRGIDVVVSLLSLLVTAPLMALTALAIRLESGGPVLFKQNRVGMNGTDFEMLKFRSMCQNAEQHGPAWTRDGDRRITRIGSFIRHYRLDELPQLINVLRGDMSLIGPRPEQPYFVELLTQEVPYYGQRHTVRPGISGWAQVKFKYGASIEETKTKLEYDLFYLKHLSFFFDLAITLETLKVLLSGRGAK